MTTCQSVEITASLKLFKVKLMREAIKNILNLLTIFFYCEKNLE